ncbi:exopolyphosphatase [Amylibacter ulvae]|uniref:Exopolyphosphatase n=1 Tax=Paramylibacter ulvae TaxID=1651968 RepID=A0ABQ3CTH4_9RHOB|nr:Ppx/GppA phosphatase family protein [Amylibacter ulvae]GHA40756.1 exopolyphosphatase [Amylibacter ulvae]
MSQNASDKVIAFPNVGNQTAGVAQETELFGALDLGTNSCRMLIAHPRGEHFEVVDAFSKPVYLGAGLEKTGKLSAKAIHRTMDALHVCAKKLRHHNVQNARLIATASCRQASNGRDFVKRVFRQTGLRLEIIKPEEEARLAAIGCAAHLRRSTEQVLVIDIGGGSTELVWLDLADVEPKMRRAAMMGLRTNLKKPRTGTPFDGVKVVDWISVPFGVTTLRDQFSDVDGDKDRYAMMSWYFEEYIAQFGPVMESNEQDFLQNFQIIGTSGTVTTIASTHLRLPRYDRDLVDGQAMSAMQVDAEVDRYLHMGPKGRESEPCIGRNRKDLIMSGAAILQAILRVWSTDTLTIADRGLREGLLYSQMVKAGHLK